ncbi:DUF805 domain-containing protein [Pelagibacterium halotolerans]|uniref:DUF805 domain-containing protein n=1 Tax=Pelagibacterium halotolerans TaxID=531813 RepID=UPI00384EC0B1
MNIKLFTSLDGRIPLTRFWIGLLTIWGLSLAFLFSIVLISFKTNTGMIDFETSRIVLTALSVVAIYPILAIFVKRLHDRNKPAIIWLPIFWGPGIVGQIAQFLGFNLSAVTLSRTQMVPNLPGIIYSVIAFVIGLWMIVELGFLKGTTGPNRFGPDPYQQ